jgi:ribosomal protein L7/L12
VASLEDLEQRLSLIESRVQQLFEHLDIAPGDRAAGKDLDPNDDPEIQDLLAKGNEAQAIKRYQELTGLGKDEAKRAIERAQNA